MTIIPDNAAEALQAAETVVTLGSFDGVHRGHVRVLGKVTQIAHETGDASVVITMRPHPREHFSPDHAPNLLTCDGKKARLLEALGIEFLMFLRFDDKIACMEPSAFVEDIVVRKCHARNVIVGHDFRFGRDAEGDYALLKQLGRHHGFDAYQVPPLLVGGECVSSSLIRERIIEGDLEQAEALLGRPYSIVGEVTPGRGIGRSLGFPTANIRPHHSAVPAQGVYAAMVTVEGSEHPAAVNIGIAPTIRHEDITIEAHLVGHGADLLGKTIEVVFLKHLRPERKFNSQEALVRQIELDVQEVEDHVRSAIHYDAHARTTSE